MKFASFILLLSLVMSPFLMAQGLYEQSDGLERGIEVIEAGVELYRLDKGFSPEKLNGLKEVSRHAQEIFTQLKDKDILNTERGEYFKKRYKHLMNYLSVGETFSECLKGEEEQKVSLKIMGALEKDFNNVEVTCRDLKAHESTDFDEFYSNVMAVAGKKRIEDVYQDTSEQALLNYARTYTNMKYSFEKDAQPEDFVHDLCKRKCDPKLKYKILKEIDKEYKTLVAQKAPRLDNESILSQLHQKVKNVNSAIDELNTQVSTRKRSLWWDAMDEGEDFGPKYQNYLAHFMKNVNEGAGILLLTEEMKEAIGSPRLKDDYEKSGDQYEFPKHDLPSLKRVKQAKNEVFSNLRKEFQKTNESRQERESSKKTQEKLEDLLISNPIAAAQMLNRSPEYAHLLCEPLKEIHKEKKFDEKLDNVMLIGGAVLGVGLMATGVGALVGGWLLAGTATAATLASAGTIAGIAGFTLGAVEGGYWSKRMIDHKHDIKVFESSILAGASDESSYQEAAESLQKFNEAKFDAILSLGFSGIESLAVVKDAGRLTRSMRNAEAVGELTSAQKRGAMKKVTDTFERIAKNPNLLIVMNKLKKVLDAEKFGKFLASLSSLSDKARLAILKNLASLKPSLLDGDVGTALADALNQSITKGDLTTLEAKAMGEFLERERVANLIYRSDQTQFAAKLEITSPESLKKVEDTVVSTQSRVEIETDRDFSFYLSQLDEGDREFTMKFIQLNRNGNTPKEEIVKRLKNSVGQCRL